MIRLCVKILLTVLTTPDFTVVKIQCMDNFQCHDLKMKYPTNVNTLAYCLCELTYSEPVMM